MSTNSTISAAREEFPVTKAMLYLDSAHQTPLCTSVKNALISFLNEGHQFAGPKPTWVKRIDDTRAAVAALLKAAPSEIAFTKNTSESLNIAANAVPLQAGDNVILLEGDHPNNAYAWLNLRKKGVEVRFVPLDDDQVADAETFKPYIDSKTKVISLSHVTFHAGQVHDVGAIGQLCKSKGIYFVVDAMQSVGVIPLDVKAMNISVLAAGTHKGFLVPQGLGVLYVEDSLKELQPAFIAMSSMARPPEDYIARPDDMETRPDALRFEMGNLNLPDLHALNAAVALINRFGVDSIQRHVVELGSLLLQGLDAVGVKVIGPRATGAYNHIFVLNLPVEKWTKHFADSNVRVSPERGGIRVSFALFNNQQDVEHLLNVIKAGLQ